MQEEEPSTVQTLLVKRARNMKRRDSLITEYFVTAKKRSKPFENMQLEGLQTEATLNEDLLQPILQPYLEESNLTCFELDDVNQNSITMD